SYTSKGFTPFIIEVSLGESVRFINSRSDRALWVTSTHPAGAAEYYAGFSGSKSLARGESFTVPFTKVGAWSYKNLNDGSHQGVILVK
ncbi:MAG: Copper binding protein plastocyanin/azurin family, partial [Candidatus Parcubacteria bacterium]